MTRLMAGCKAPVRGVLAIVALLCLTGTVEGQMVLVDDLLRGETTGVLVGEGEFLSGSGWRSMGGRIVYDSGRQITHGSFEATLRGWSAPTVGVAKSHPLSGWEHPDQYTHYVQTGSFWNWRIGTGYNPFKVLAAPQGIMTRQEARVGTNEAVNDGQPHVYRVVWQDGRVEFSLDGQPLQSWQFERFSLRYFTIGKDDWYDLTSPAPIISGVRVVDLSGTGGTPNRASAGSLDRTGTLWAPYIEWTLENPSHEGNPYDLVAWATFTHTQSGEQRTTGLFYAGGNTWNFRFTGTRTGEWTFVTAGDEPALAGRRGTVTVEPNDDPRARGFVGRQGRHWVWTGTGQAFVPQLVMYVHPDAIPSAPDRLDADLHTWFVEHGFNGLHVPVFCRWFDIARESRDGIPEDPNPDPRTFDALERLITRTYQAGGMVHLWVWGDEDRKMTPMGLVGGTNGSADRRLQRYIAARLGPIPGWSMGYGFDLWEWVNGEQLADWHAFMHSQMGWAHLLGGRWAKHELTQATEALDYASYEQHRPDYDMYVRTIEQRPDKPSFSEDRFRVRENSRWPEKDYDELLTRRGLYHAALAGGVANIWGYLVPRSAPGGQSQPYPNAHWIRTYATFFENRFAADMVRDNALTDGVCLRSGDRARYVFYREDASAVRMDLSAMPAPQPAVAVDAAKPYAEIDLGVLPPGEHVWAAPYESDWAIAVGTFPPSARRADRQ